MRNFSELTPTNCGYIFKRWQRFVGDMPTKENLSDFIIKMREAGLSPVTCNITIRTFNSFLVWLKEKEVIEEMRMKLLPEEKTVKQKLPDVDIKKILAFKLSGTNETRIYAITSPSTHINAISFEEKLDRECSP